MIGTDKNCTCFHETNNSTVWKVLTIKGIFAAKTLTITYNVEREKRARINRIANGRIDTHRTNYKIGES